MTVAVCFQSDRASTVTMALDAVAIPHAVNPDWPEGFGAIITDTLGRAGPDLRTDTPVFFRLRGDMWRERASQGRSRLTSWLSDAYKFRHLDGVIAPDSHLADRVRNRPADPDVKVIGLPIDVDAWPVEYHDRDRLELVTLTNFDYWGKVEPLERWFQDLNLWLKATGSVWRVAGDGEHVPECKEWAGGLSNVEYAGFVEPAQALRRADVALHVSGWDIQSPNAILEAYAAGVPVVASDYAPFVGVHETATLGPGLFDKLEWYQDPEHRRERGEALREYVRTHHSPEAIGRRYAEVLP